jgi:phenylalanyl-tRNA synthetase beta chain
MEYSLHTLNKVADLQSLKLSEFIDRLNLIGFEVDEIYNETLYTNRFLDNTRLLIKIPPNREDLLNEKNFLNELSTIFSFNLFKNSKQLSKDYSSIIQQIYNEQKEFEYITINSKLISPFTEQRSNEVKILMLELENFENFQCPLWIQNKLKDSGLSYKNTIDDLISLVKLEWGQSINYLNFNKELYNFSVEQLIEPLIYKDQNQNIYNLTPGTLVIKDQQNNIHSVLGLFNTSQDLFNSSKKLLLECIYYDIHSNHLLLNPLDNKISLRYLRSMSLINFKSAFKRLITLIELTSNAKVKSRIYSTQTKSNSLKYFKILTLRKNLLKKFLNLNSIDLKIFTSAGFILKEEKEEELIFSIPIQRNDLTREIDLIEEYSRFIGYENFKPILPLKFNRYLPFKAKNINLIKQVMLSNGFQEVITNPLHDITKQKENSILIQNPLNQEFTCLRLSLIDKLVGIFENNLKFRNYTTKFFELGRVFKKEVNNNSFKEIDKLGGIFQLGQYKKIDESSREWLIAKGFIENLLLHFAYKDITFEKIVSQNDYFHPTKTVLVKVNQKTLGIFGEITPKIENLKYSKFATYIFELNLSYLTNKRLKSTIPNFEAFYKYPNIIKDISFSISKNINFYDLKKLASSTSKFVKHAEFFDIYFAQNQQNIVNIGLRLNFQPQSSSFTNEVIDEEIIKIKNVLISYFNAEFK